MSEFNINLRASNGLCVLARHAYGQIKYVRIERDHFRANVNIIAHAHELMFKAALFVFLYTS